MSIGRGLVIGALAGAAGAGLWIGGYALTGYSVGITAILIGGLVGWGMGYGNGGRGGAGAGLLAAAVTLAAVLGARLGVAQVQASRMIAEAMTITEEDVHAALAEDLYAQFEAEGRAMSEPEEEGAYPPEVVAAAARRWRVMSEFAREEYVRGLAARRQEEARAAAPVLTGLAFIFGFSLMGLVCVGLGMTTAYKIASTVVGQKEEEEGAVTVESVGPSSGALGAFARLGPAGAEPSAAPAATAEAAVFKPILLPEEGQRAA